MRSFDTESGVGAVAGIDPRVVRQPVEEMFDDVGVELVEVGRVGRAADPAREQRVTCEHMRRPGGIHVEQRDAAGRMTAQVNDLERGLSDLDSVAAGELIENGDR